MLKRRYKIFLGVFLLIIVLGAYLSAQNPYSYTTTPVWDHGFSVTSEETPLADHILAWFTFSDNVGTLHLTEEAGESVTQVWFRYAYGDAATASIDGFSYTDEMNGTLLVEGASADGNILFSAKSQTVDTQSYDTYAWDSHVFGNDAIPVEICYNGSSNLTTEVTVLVYGMPYTGTVSVQSVAGRDETVKLTDGSLSGLKIQDLREGLFITVQAENGVTLVGSYIVEDYPMFSLAYLSGLSNLFLLTASVAMGGGTVCLVRAGFRKYRQRPAYSRGQT